MMCLGMAVIPIGLIGIIQGFRSESVFLIGIIFIITYTVSFVVAYFITKPIEKLTKNIDKISKGKLDVTLENSEIYEINNLTVSLDRVMASLKLAIHKVGVKKDGYIQGFRGVNTDISKEKKAEARIMELNNELLDLKIDLTKLLNECENKKTFASPIKNYKKNIDEKWSEHEYDYVFIFDENANILDCNNQMYKKLGYTKSELLNLNMADIDALESKKEILERIKKVKKDGVVVLKTIHKRKDGSTIFIDENLRYLKKKNEFKGIVHEDYSLKKI